MKAARQQGIGGTAVLCIALVWCWSGARALDLDFPGVSELVRSDPVEAGQIPVARGPWRDGAVPTDLASGAVQDVTWQVTGDGLTSLTLFDALQDQIVAQGFDVTFTCFADGCGGFDFRHALPLGQPPEMYVDLGNFHYLSARLNGPDGSQDVALTVSFGGATGFVHLSLVQPEAEAAAPVVQSTRTPDAEDGAVPAAPALEARTLIDLLIERGSAPLSDLQFETGASELRGESYASLTALAAYLAQDPERRVVLVGHTDATGSLAGNIALSEARANAARRFLIEQLNVSAAQVEAQGIGFLAPRAPNTTPEGREANRRVEVVLANPT